MKNQCLYVQSGSVIASTVLLFIFPVLIFPFFILAHPACAEKATDVSINPPAEETPVELEFKIRPGNHVEDESDGPKIAPTGSQARPAASTPVPYIGTSRPSFTDASTTVPQGSFQVESGATYTDNSGGTRSWVLPESLLRLGVTRNTELRFTTPNYAYLRGDHTGRLLNNEHSGTLLNNFGDISVGMSQHFSLPGKIEMAVIPILNLPTGADVASSNSLDPQVRVSVGHPLNAKLSIGGHLDTRWNTGHAAVAKTIFNPTFITYYYPNPKLGFFLEYSGFYPTTGKTTQFIQAGSLFTPTPRQQFDVRIATGLNSASPDILVGFGYSFRIDGLFGASRAFGGFGPWRMDTSTSKSNARTP